MASGSTNGIQGAAGNSNDAGSNLSSQQQVHVTLNSLKQEVDALKNKRVDMQIDEALSNIRTLASRPKLTSPCVLLAAIEVSRRNSSQHES